MGENNFPKKIRSILEYLDIIYDEQFECYEGIAQNKKYSDGGDMEISFNLSSNTYNGFNVCCYINNGLDYMIFEISDQVSNGTFIVLLQEFGIIHNRYVYEAVDNIEEYFNESNEL